MRHVCDPLFCSVVRDQSRHGAPQIPSSATEDRRQRQLRPRIPGSAELRRKLHCFPRGHVVGGHFLPSRFVSWKMNALRTAHKQEPLEMLRLRSFLSIGTCLFCIVFRRSKDVLCARFAVVYNVHLVQSSQPFFWLSPVSIA